MFVVFKKHPKKMLLLCAFLIFQFFNFTGFCYSEVRYLTKEELLKRAGGKLYEENPYCCNVTYGHYDKIVFSNPVMDFIDTIFGYQKYGFEYVMSRKITQYEHDVPPSPYSLGHGSINVCGSGGHEEYSEQLTEVEYKKYTDMIKTAREKDKIE